MKRVLCISPFFPPMNTPDMQRLRQALPYLRDQGWEPIVVAVDPDCCEGSRDPLLLQSVPSDVEVIRVGAFSARLTRAVGVGNLGLRCWPQLRSTVNRYLAQHPVDLIFFSTTVFTAIAHGPVWKRRFGIPFIVDLQDPWRNDYYLTIPPKQRPQKFWFDYRQKALLEARTMPHADAMLAVSGVYLDTMRQRYPVLAGRPAITLPFGAAPEDFTVARSLPATRARTPASPPGSTVTMRYIGRGGPDMAVALTILFRAVRQGIARRPELFSRLRFEFVGTSYARAGHGLPTVLPVAEKEGVAALVTESPDRIPYFQTLRALMDADLLIVPGSDDAGYTASKIYPYILAGRPLLTIFRDTSSVVDVMTETRAGELVTFGAAGVSKEAVLAAEDALARLLTGESAPMPPGSLSFDRYTARAMTARLAALFDEVVPGTPASARTKPAESDGGRRRPAAAVPRMKRVLCISPHFPPVNTPDMQRLRQMLPHLRDCGWEAAVLCVDPSLCEAPRDPVLLQTIPQDIEVIQTGAFDARLTRLAGIGNLGFRSWLQMRHAGNRYLAQNRVDLILFTTTVFTAIAHGPAWKHRFDVPFAVDLQDPWRNDFYLRLPRAARPRKFWFDYRQKAFLEARTLPHADGVIAVSQAYLDTVVARYPELTNCPMKEIPFGADANDMAYVLQKPELNTIFKKSPHTLDIVFAGVVPPSMAKTLQASIAAVHRYNVEGDGKKLVFHFVGTLYTPPSVGEPGPATSMAASLGAEESVSECVERKSFFEALRTMIDADILAILGTEDSSYNASKLALTLMTGRPILAIVHKNSILMEQLRRAGVDTVAAYDDASDSAAMMSIVIAMLNKVCGQLDRAPVYNREAIHQHTAAQRTRQVVEVMNAAVNRFSQLGGRGS